MTEKTAELAVAARGNGAAALAETMRRLVHANRTRLFGDNPAAVEVLDVMLGPERHRREDRAHRALTVRYRQNGREATLALWLKFRPGLDRLFPVLAAFDERLGGRVFPTPYFTGQDPSGDAAFVATAFVAGEVLRNRLIRLGAMRRSGRLAPVFAANGDKMRQFHEAFAPAGSIAIDAVVAEAGRLTQASRDFSPAERNAVLEHLARCRAALPMTALPAVTNHNDWVLKNIIVAPDGTDRVIDCDSMRHPPHWRWFDVVYLLLNVESQRKWFPLVTAAMTGAAWRHFWRGYVGEGGLPDGLTPPQLAAVLYIVRVEWLVGGTVRPPYFAIMDGAFDRPFLRSLRRSVVCCRYSLIDFLDV